MIIDTSSIKEGSTFLEQSTTLDAFMESLPPLIGKIECTAMINRIRMSIFIQLQYRGVLRLQCARCLKDYEQTVSGECRVILEERSGFSGPATEEDTPDFYFDNEHTQVDISASLFDEIMISLPLMPLCSELCRGVDVKRNADIVDSEPYDPRWEALNKLKKKK